MFDWLRYRHNLARLQRAHRKALRPLEAQHVRAVRELKTNPQANVEENEAYFRFLEERDRQAEERAKLQTEYLQDLAAKRLIPMPEFRDMDKWIDERHRGIILSDASIRELRLALRNDRRERLEIVRSWVATIVPGMTGLLGVIVALLAIVLGHR